MPSGQVRTPTRRSGTTHQKSSGGPKRAALQAGSRFPPPCAGRARGRAGKGAAVAEKNRTGACRGARILSSRALIPRPGPSPVHESGFAIDHSRESRASWTERVAFSVRAQATSARARMQILSRPSRVRRSRRRRAVGHHRQRKQKIQDKEGIPPDQQRPTLLEAARGWPHLRQQHPEGVDAHLVLRRAYGPKKKKDKKGKKKKEARRRKRKRRRARQHGSRDAARVVPMLKQQKEKPQLDRNYVQLERDTIQTFYDITTKETATLTSRSRPWTVRWSSWKIITASKRGANCAEFGGGGGGGAGGGSRYELLHESPASILHLLAGFRCASTCKK